MACAAAQVASRPQHAPHRPLRDQLRRRAAAGDAALRALGGHAARALPGRVPARSTPRARRSASPGEIAWFPDRTYAGRTYVPAVARTTEGYELFGFVSFTEGSGGPSDFEARADFTAETGRGQPGLEARPQRRRDRRRWRGEQGKTADMTLVWGVPLIPAARSSPPSSRTSRSTSASSSTSASR